MYVMRVTDTAGDEAWFEGDGWYWTDQYFMMHGPYLTEDGALYDYAWCMNKVIDVINTMGEVM